MPNFAALRAAVFPSSTKNLRGGADIRPPVGAQVKKCPTLPRATCGGWQERMVYCIVLYFILRTLHSNSGFYGSASQGIRENHLYNTPHHL